MVYIVDRIEGNIVVLEDESGNIFKYEYKMFKTKVNEGDTVKLKNGLFVLNKELTNKKREEARKILDDLWE